MPTHHHIPHMNYLIILRNAQTQYIRQPTHYADDLDYIPIRSLDTLLATIYLFFFNDPPTPEIYTLPLHDALPILREDVIVPGAVARGPGPRFRQDVQALRERGRAVRQRRCPHRRGRLHYRAGLARPPRARAGETRSEEHTSELQSRPHLVCRPLLA